MTDEKKKRKERPILAYAVNAEGDMAKIEGFPIGITKKSEAVKWAMWQANEPGGILHIVFFKSCGSFKGVQQMKLGFEVE